MSQPIGGLRLRLIHDSFYSYLKAGLTALGWFNTGRAHSPIMFLDYPLDRLQPISPNTIALSSEDTTQMGEEIGSNLQEVRWAHYLDIYAESEPMGLHLRGDLEGLAMGRFSAIGYNYPGFPVFDYTQTPPVQVFSVLVENPVQDHGQDWTGSKPWLAHWHIVRLDLVDWVSADNSPIVTP